MENYKVLDDTIGQGKLHWLNSQNYSQLPIYFLI